VARERKRAFAVFMNASVKLSSFSAFFKGDTMWQKFTERARRVILLGQEEAGKMGSGHVGTEHLLLGLVSESEGVASQVLQKMGVSLNKVREQINDEAETGEGESTGSEPKLTPKAKRVLEYAADEARRMRHNYIGTEHLLLALLREKDGQAAKVLQTLGLSLETLREDVVIYLGTDDFVSQRSFDARRSGQMEPDVEGLLVEVLRAAMASHRNYSVEHIVEALLRKSDWPVVNVLRDCGLDVEKAINELAKRSDEQKNTTNL